MAYVPEVRVVAAANANAKYPALRYILYDGETLPAELAQVPSTTTIKFGPGGTVDHWTVCTHPSIDPVYSTNGYVVRRAMCRKSSSGGLYVEMLP